MAAEILVYIYRRQYNREQGKISSFCLHSVAHIDSVGTLSRMQCLKKGDVNVEEIFNSVLRSFH